MSDSELFDFSRGGNRPPEESGPRWRSRVSSIVLVVVVAAALLAGGWIYLRAAHASELEAFAVLRERLAVLDQNVEPLLFGSTAPCGPVVDEGVVTRTYSPETGPTPETLRGALRLVGFWPTSTSPGALYTMDQFVDGQRLVVDVMGVTLDTMGASLRATSPATALACRFG